MSRYIGETDPEVTEYGGFERDCNDRAVQAQMRLAAIRDERRRVAAMQSSIAEDLPTVKQLFGTTTLAAPVGRRQLVRGD